jgi:hypothetical protein
MHADWAQISRESLLVDSDSRFLQREMATCTPPMRHIWNYPRHIWNFSRHRWNDSSRDHARIAWGLKGGLIAYKYAACVALRLRPCASFVRCDALSIHIYTSDWREARRGATRSTPRLREVRFRSLCLIGDDAQGSLVVRDKIPRPFPADRIAWMLSVPRVENLLPLRVGLL